MNMIFRFIAILLVVFAAGCVKTETPVFDLSRGDVLPFRSGYYEWNDTSISYLKVLNQRIVIQADSGAKLPSELIGIRLSRDTFLIQAGTINTEERDYYLITFTEDALQARIWIPSCNRHDVVTVFARNRIKTSGTGVDCTLQGATPENLIPAYREIAERKMVDEGNTTILKFLPPQEGKARFK